jgi:hypothetical protein
VQEGLHWADCHSMDIRLKEHKQHIRLEHLDKLGRGWTQLSTTDTAFNSTILPSLPGKPDIWPALSGRLLKLNSTLTISTERVAFVTVNHGVSYQLPKNFWYVTWFHILKPVCKQPHPLPPPPKFGISFCSLAIYKPMPLPAITTPLCILNLVFHTNVSILTQHFFAVCVGC